MSNPIAPKKPESVEPDPFGPDFEVEIDPALDSILAKHVLRDLTPWDSNYEAYTQWYALAFAKKIDMDILIRCIRRDPGLFLCPRITFHNTIFVPTKAWRPIRLILNESLYFQGLTKKQLQVIPVQYHTHLSDELLAALGLPGSKPKHGWYRAKTPGRAASYTHSKEFVPLENILALLEELR